MEDTAEIMNGMVQMDGHQYYWERHGVTQRSTLVFLNGMASSTASWSKYLPFVSDTHDVILYDYLGQGKSDAPDEPYSIGEFANALDAVLDVNKVGRAWLVGASYGGFVALEMMRLHPEKVRGLFLSGVLLERVRLFEMYLDLSLRWYRELPFEVYPDYLYERCSARSTSVTMETRSRQPNTISQDSRTGSLGSYGSWRPSGTG